MKSRENKVFQLVMAALFAALICVGTMLMRIPVPATGGYVNLGDGILLLGAFLMNPVYAAMAAGIGSMLADVLAGYMQYAVATLIIKSAMAYCGAFLFRKLMAKMQNKKMLLPMLLSGVVAEIYMVIGYFVFEALLLGYGLGAAAAIMGNVGQGVMGVVIACVAGPLLLRNTEVRNLLNRIWK